MKRIPKKCLTCNFADFEDDGLEVLKCYNIPTTQGDILELEKLSPLRCFHPFHKSDVNWINDETGGPMKPFAAGGLEVDPDDLCGAYKVNPSVVEDAKMGCW